MPASATSNADYAELKRRVTALGLFERQPAYYRAKLALTLALLALGIAALFATDSVAALVALGVFLAIVYGQIGFVLHDAAHRQISPPGRRADVLVLVAGSLLLGVSGSWWKHKHDLHHAHPNDTDHDPDARISLLAFTQAQALEKPWYLRPLTRHQAWLIFAFLLFEGLQLRGAGVKYLLQTKTRHRLADAGLIAVHVAGYVALLVAAVGVADALLVAAVHQALFGLYVGSVFAPNHKGMPVVDGTSRLGFLEQQVLTARNVRGSPFVDWWYGGLNYQIEHHLFPRLPRNRLRAAQPVVRAFCAERGVSYYETSLLGSYRELVSSLYEASAPLRGRVPTPVPVEPVDSAR